VRDASRQGKPAVVNFALEHIGLPARAPAALKDWYARSLEARLVFENPEAPAFLLRLPGGAMIEIYGAEASIPEVSNNKLGGWRHVALRVDSIDDAQSELERRGVRFAEPSKPAGGGGRVLFFQDPEGNLLHLVERPADTELF
jgi:glyoxylase I family protein